MTFAKTDLGHEVLKSRTMPLTPRQRAMLIMADGGKDGAQLLALTAGMGTTVEDLTELVMKGLIVSTGVASPKPAAAPAPEPVMVATQPLAPEPPPEPPAATRAPDYKTAYTAGVSLTSGLGFKGFRLNMSMESASNVDEIKALRPKLLDVLTSAHGEAKARDMLREFDRALGLR
jgi:hypothetical protein